MFATGVTNANPSEFPRSVGKKCVPAMQMECCIEGCDAKYGQVSVSFHRFPISQTSRGALRRQLWIEAAGLPNNNAIVNKAIICGQHFEKGKPSHPVEVSSPNWVPTLKLKTKKAVSLVSTSTDSIEPTVSTAMAMNTITPQRLQVPSVPIMGPQIIPKDLFLPAYCRLCLAEDVHMVFPKDARVYHQLADKLKECLNLVISIGELTYSLICKKCYESLEQLHQFRTRCARQNIYLNMRKSLEPDRKQPLRYKDNWYWYSCLGNGMNSIIWGCSVVCCPAFIVSHPSGKICSKYANHQHKQKMEDVKSVYCHGEYIFDGYRYSFEIINSNRTLTFICRSLHDPHRTCPAVLITNDRSEVLSVRSVHNHKREIIIESAVKDGSDGAKRSITLIRGISQEIVFCQGFWYTTVSEQSNISHWSCIRHDCSSTIAMVNGIVKFFGAHTHLPVLLKWGAEEDKTMEPKGPTLMKVVNPSSSKSVQVRAVPPVASRESTTIVHSRHSGILSTARICESDGKGLPNEIINPQSAVEDEPLLSTIKVEPTNDSTNPFGSTPIVRTPAPISSLPNQPLIISAAAMAPKATHIPKVFVRSNHPIQVVKRTSATTVRVVPPPLQKQPAPQVVTPKPSVPVSEPLIPKIVHVMSLNLNHSSNQPKQTVPELPVPQLMAEPELDDSQQVIKQEPLDEPETITDEIRPTMVTSAPGTDVMRREELPKPPPLTPRPMLLVSSASVFSDNTLSVTTLDPASNDASFENGGSSQETVSADEEEDCLNDLQDDEDIPPIVPIDADLEQRIVGNQYSTRVLPNGKTQVVRKVILSRGSTTIWTGNPRVVHTTQTGQSRFIKPGHDGKSTVAKASGTAAISDDLLTVSLNRAKTTRMYGRSSGAQKRFNEVGELKNNTTIKKTKTNEPLAPLETTIVDTEKYIEPDGLDQEQSPAEDPIAVAIEPHQNVQSDDGDDDDDYDDDEKEETENRSSTSQKTNIDSENSANAETLVSTRTSTEKPAKQIAGSPVPEQTASLQPQASSDPSLNRSDKKTHSKTVQLVKLQKTEQMLSHEGHLYKIKWHNRRRVYWDCMLREQVNCMAILETHSNNCRFWNKIGSHNHKVPKPIINDDNRGRYQMLTSDTGAANVKNLPGQTLQINDIEEQEGRMMNLAMRKMFNFKIRKVDQSLPTLYFANYEYEFRNVVDPGFRWKCTTCNNVLETDEKFTIAQEQGSIPHDHEPEVTVINLVDEGTLVEAGNSKTADESKSSSSSQQQLPQQTPADVDETSSSDQNKTVDSTKQTIPEQEDNAKSDEPSFGPNLPTSKPDSDAEDDHRPNSEMLLDSFTGELKKRAELREDGSDDEEMVLDPSTGELCKRGDLKRKEYRKAILEDIVADDDDDEAEYLDPLTGKLRRRGDKSLSEDEPLDDEGDTEVDESTPQSETRNMPNEDFEELLNPDPKDSAEAKKSKRPKKNSLAALKLILTLHKQLRKPDSERNFEVLPSTDNATCLIRFNEFTYELDTIQGSFSVWKCHLSPQYACRGKVHLSTNCRQISVSGVNHCHVPTLKDMFIDRSNQEGGQIKDTDQDNTREYTFFKRSDHAYQLKLDDGYLYNCITISKTGVSCWRCASRQSCNCKAIITMEGDFESMARNRFNHSHDPVPLDGAAVDAGTAGGDDAEEKDSSFDSQVAPAKRTNKNENEDDRKKRKRQTL
ncbi:uncharacterized protein LOC135703982 [Ochlerotatus camptorhynchus]|uniref:uncharacterized protein LOC135703982 n=1 Tax=Ochlerotatus camptorhynchus TaxID=644619 RepID=UPI0031CDDA43